MNTTKQKIAALQVRLEKASYYYQRSMRLANQYSKQISDLERKIYNLNCKGRILPLTPVK